MRRFSSTVSGGNDRAAAHELDDADLHPQLGVGVGDRATVEPDDAAFGDPEPADDAQQRRLAGAVGAEQRERLALVHVEADVEQHLHLAVGEVEVAHLDAPGRSASGCCSRVLLVAAPRSSSSTTIAMSWRMYRAPSAISAPPMSAAGSTMIVERAAAADRVAQQPGEHRAEERAEQEHVDADHRDAAGPQAVRDDRRDRRDDDREAPPGPRVADPDEDRAASARCSACRCRRR